MKRKEILSAYRKGPDHVVDLVNELLRTIEDLKLAFALQNERIKKLEGKLAKNSGNSSKPPSSDGPDKKLKTGGKRGGGKTGGQKGHRGRTLEMVANPDRTVILPATECEHCGCSSDGAVKNHEKRQEFEIPPLKIEVIEYIAEYFKCAHCGKITRAKFPEHIKNPAQYGVRFRSLILYLNQYQLIPYERTVEFF